MFESALSRLGKDRKAFEEKGYKLKAQYDKEKKEYQKLSEDKRESWLKEKGYLAEDFEDFNDDVSEDNELDNSSEMKYAKKGYKRRDVNEITEKEYYHHAWASANNLLSKEEFGVLDSAVGKISKGDYYLKNADGFYMIPVGENGVLNKIVLTDGEYNNYSIDTIIEIALNNETELSIERENIYASESKRIQTETNELLKVHYSKDYRFSDFKRNVDNGLRDSNGEQDGARSDRAIKFSHKDSQGRNLNKAQQDFFKDSKVVDENGNLRVVYHGTVGEFYTFDKTYLGSATGTNDAKLGFFFTSNEEVAEGYAVNAHDNKYFNLAHKIANGDREKLNKLLKLDGYKEFAMTEDVKEFGKLQDKGEAFDNDIYEVYLNIKNPLVDDWHGKLYKKAKMLKLITRAMQGDYDGVIIKNIDDTYDQYGIISDVYVAFEPNQIKLTTNKAPTESNDMRFSYKTNAYEFVDNNTNENNSLRDSFETLDKYSETEKISIEKNANFTVAETYLDIQNFISELYNFNTFKSF